MTDPFTVYCDIRGRMVDLARSSDADALATTVPSCPDWSVLQLLTHCVSMPVAIGAGDMPGDDLQGWIDRVLAERDGRSLGQLVDEWESADPVIEAMVSGPGGVLLDDLMIHEHDLRGALGRPDHSAFEADVFVDRALRSFVPALDTRDLGAIEIRHGSRSWRSHDADIGWIIEASPWEAVRVLASRRTADEIRDLGGSEDLDSYIALVDDHLPLPTASLGEH